MVKRALGRGLEALLPGASKSEDLVTELPVNNIEASAYQPRKFFEDEKLSELAASIREHGIVQPIVVRPLDKERYQLIAGERRWRACMMLGLDKIPAVIKEVKEVEAREISLVENLQREELNPLEEAEAYRQLIQEYGFTQESLAKRMGKSRSYIANAMRLLGLSDQLKERIKQGVLTIGHAKVLLGVSDVQERERMGNEIVEKGLTVRETEKLVQRPQPELIPQSAEQQRNEGKGNSRKRKSTQSGNVEPEKITPEMTFFEDKLRDKLGTRVKLKWSGEGRGLIEIEFYDLEDLERIRELLDIK
ncbi:MAG: ParB/RepB/Spo0J family partition protein [Bacillota bacterium]|jgi:ParB family chromosome partitioning protein